MPSNLTIYPTKPFKSSRLALPPSPFSPRFPLSPPFKHHSETQHSVADRSISPKRPDLALVLLSRPPEPLHWLWQCHLCNRVYRLGVTRRCLEDGHLFCSGTMTVKRSRRGHGKKTVRHKACASELDYAGWKAWGTWRRDMRRRVADVVKSESDYDDGGGGGALGRVADAPKPLFAPRMPEEGRWFGGRWAKKGKQGGDFRSKDCWGTCDYPSECRWGKQYGVATPTLPSPPPPQEEGEKTAKTKFEDILLTIPEAGWDTTRQAAAAAAGGGGEGEVAPQSPPLSPELPESLEEPTKKPTRDDLLESAKRRKRRSSGAVVDVPSPLASHPPSPTTVSTARAMDLATAAEPVAAVPPPPMGSRAGAAAGPTALQRAFDDFDLDFRRSFERAEAALTGFVSAVRSTAAPVEEEGLDGKRDGEGRC